MRICFLQGAKELHKAHITSIQKRINDLKLYHITGLSDPQTNRYRKITIKIKNIYILARILHIMGVANNFHPKEL